MKTNKQIFESIGNFSSYITAKNVNDSYHAAKVIIPFTMKLCKDTISYGNIYLFISSRLYANTSRSFVYATLYQSNTLKPFRKKRSYDIEGNKQFFSAKTHKKILTLIKKTANFDKFVLS